MRNKRGTAENRSAGSGTALARPRSVSAELKRRTKTFALDVLSFARELESDPIGRLLRPQLVRAGTGVGSNYRASCRGKSKADFIAKLATAEEEADEAGFWLEILVESGCVKPERVARLLDEANQLTAIFVTSIRTARRGRS
jgi:four helix bundle protein